MEFFDKVGIMAIGSRLKMLSDKITEDANKIYTIYGIDLKAKWFPVFVILSDGSSQTITDIAKQIGHSHPSVSNIVKEMQAMKLITESKNRVDGRKNMVSLSNKGISIANDIKVQYADVTTAVNKIAAATDNNLWEAIGEWEKLLSETSLLERVKEERKKRERENIQIVQYNPSYKQIFRQLNEDWITSHWEMEDADYEALDHPQEYIIDKGGYIFIALYKNDPVGVCALYNMIDSDIYDYELAKYAVSPKAQGKGIGVMLCEAAIAKVKELGGHKIFLESNTFLKPAIHIYKKIGFEELKNYKSTAYARGNIQMKLDLD